MMNCLKLHSLVLLGVFLTSASWSDGAGQCEHMFVCVGEKVTIKCSITNPDQDGVSLFTQREETGTNEKVLFYYNDGKDGILTPDTPFRGRVETNRDFRDLSVSISDVSEQDGGVYWCRFNKFDKFTISERTCLLVQPEIERNMSVYCV